MRYPNALSGACEHDGLNRTCHGHLCFDTTSNVIFGSALQCGLLEALCGLWDRVWGRRDITRQWPEDHAERNAAVVPASPLAVPFCSPRGTWSAVVPGLRARPYPCAARPTASLGASALRDSPSCSSSGSGVARACPCQMPGSGDPLRKSYLRGNSATTPTVLWLVQFCQHLGQKRSIGGLSARS